MKFRCLCLLFLLALGAGGVPVCFAEEAARGCTLRVHVDGLRNANGVVGVLLFRSSDGWPENVARSFQHQASPIAKDAHDVSLVFTGVPEGDYGIVALHDENKNMKLDRNMFGFPKEGFGFSSNPHVGLGPPSFDSARLHVVCPETVADIHILYK